MVEGGERKPPRRRSDRPGARRPRQSRGARSRCSGGGARPTRHSGRTAPGWPGPRARARRRGGARARPRAGAPRRPRCARAPRRGRPRRSTRPRTGAPSRRPRRPRLTSLLRSTATAAGEASVLTTWKSAAARSREGALSRAGVEHAPARVAREEQVEQERLAQRMARPDEVGRRSPLVWSPAVIREEHVRGSSATCAEHGLARVLAVARRARLSRSPARAPGRPRGAGAQRLAPPGRRAGRAARFRRPRAARARAGVSPVTSGVPHASAWNALFGITRAALADVPKIAQRTPAPVQLPRQPLVLDPRHVLDVRRRAPRAAARAARCRRRGTRSSGASRAAARIVSRPCSGMSLPTKRHVNGSARSQPGPKMRSSAPTKQTATRSARQPRKPREEVGVGLRVGDDEVGGPQRAAVERASAGPAASRAEAPAVGDERVRERDERVEHDRRARARPASRPAGRSGPGSRRQRVRRRGRRRAPQSRASARASRARRRGPAASVSPPVPHVLVPLHDLDAGAPQARDHLRVARVRRARTCRSRRPCEPTTGLRRRAAASAPARRPAPRAGSSPSR